ncbi:MAG: hypothetical protein KC493_04805 [Bacteriovoracaceae bacterium]|nr:hypothetical protein [Bacteriovoracaceae bacterium]
MSDIEIRKQDHIEMAYNSRIPSSLKDGRFDYEPLFGIHPNRSHGQFEINVFDKTMNSPIWISSMTGGSTEAGLINKRLANVAGEFGLGMGLGSCRALLENPSLKEDFNLRPILGEKAPFFANLGIAQVDELLRENSEEKILELNETLKTDGLIIHLNPLQEWLQPSGDRYTRPALETLQEYCSKINIKTIVKEVGQGMGPRSLKALAELPISGIEFAAFGGTNFSALELNRNENVNSDFWKPLCHVGHTASEMVEMLNDISQTTDLSDKTFIISGGVENFLDGFHLREELNATGLIGMAGAFLQKARVGDKELTEFTKEYVLGLEMAREWLNSKKGLKVD